MARYFTSILDPELIDLLRNGAVGVMPTDTIYGIVARAQSQPATVRMYNLKPREKQPGTTISASIAQLENLGFPLSSLVIAQKYWPAALSVEMSATNIDSYLSVGQPVMAARIPDYPELIQLLEQTGPLMTTSANPPGLSASTTLQMAKNYFGDQMDFYVEGGDLSERPPSTIIGINPDMSIVVYRQGAVDINTN